ncbi:MAG: hypothetical protein CYPHOPRED_004734, partial [Cyphobasidiales sp. Tagirdzhanova-0007]
MRRSVRLLIVAFLAIIIISWNTSVINIGRAEEAFVTVISAAAYLPGALVLGRTLRHFGQGRPMIALLPPQGVTSRQTDLLQQVGWEIQYVDLLQLPSHSRAVTWRFRDMLTKLHAFNMTAFKRIALVDSDAYFVDNIDEAFELLKRSSALLAASLPATRPVSPFFDSFAGHFNGGLIMLKPASGIYIKLLRLCRDPEYYDVTFAEQ